jgi:hypothetical protein
MSAGAWQVILKCVDAKGGLVYTNKSCPAGTMQTVKVYAEGDQAAGAAQRARIEAEMQERRRSEQSSSNSSTDLASSRSTPRDLQKKRCAVARQAAKDAERRGLSYQLREGYERAVIDACFGL